MLIHKMTVMPKKTCERLLTFCCKAIYRSRLKSREISTSATHAQCPFKSLQMQPVMSDARPEGFTAEQEMIEIIPEVPRLSEAKPFHEMPGPKGLRNVPVIGNRFHYAPYTKHKMESVVEMRKEYMEKYGKVYREVLGLGWVVHIHDPVDVATMFSVEGKYPQRGFPSIFEVYDRREIGQIGMGSLIGEEWGRMRKAVQQKLMRPQHMRYFVTRMDRVAQDFINKIEQIADSEGNVHNMRDELQKYAVEEISAVLFNHRFGCMNGELVKGSEADLLIQATDELFKEFALSTRVFPWFMLFRSSLYKRFKKAGDTIHSIGWKYMLKAMEVAIEKRKNGSNPEDESDFITALLQDENLNLDYVTTIAMDMFRGAVESTSNTLTFFLHTISRNPEKQERLHEEINRLLPNRTPLSPAVLDHMPYLKACWKESFRYIFPLPAGAPRLLTKDAVMGGYHVPKGVSGEHLFSRRML
ncbi:1,25-dihydroxyvitamin D(3) 24-hydroxylase, mitochondrial-like isoform X2 [Liolophura sinensis]|uniref:1,25-dihydroxyvitamin D(3) 24-hydroxylase, mitochondrial-like isoform X2 n=1 Tax=Liolophura sinensis TaxID=3198878 RepID=UPI003158E6B5